MTKEQSEKIATGLEIGGVIIGVALGAVASVGMDGVAKRGLKMIPLSGASKVTRILAPIGIIGGGAAAGTLAGQGMQQKSERYARFVGQIVKACAKKTKEEKEKEKVDLEKKKEELKETLKVISNSNEKAMDLDNQVGKEEDNE